MAKRPFHLVDLIPLIGNTYHFFFKALALVKRLFSLGVGKVGPRTTPRECLVFFLPRHLPLQKDSSIQL